MGEDEELERAIRRDATWPIVMAVVVVASLVLTGVVLSAVSRLGVAERASRGFLDTFDAPAPERAPAPGSVSTQP